MKIDDLYPRTDEAIDADKQKTLLFLALPSVLFFVAGTLSMITAGTPDLVVYGITIPTIEGAAMMVVAIAFLCAAYLALGRSDEISYDAFLQIKKKVGQPGAVNEYIGRMKSLKRTKIVKEDLIRLNRLCKWQRQGNRISNHGKPNSAMARR
jgi:hypothetical protein